MSGGHNDDKDRWFTIERVYCISQVSGWSGWFYLSVCVAGRCLLLYSGLTQGQGHTVRPNWSELKWAHFNQLLIPSKAKFMPVVKKSIVSCERERNMHTSFGALADSNLSDRCEPLKA